MKFKVIMHDAEEGGYWATVPALPGCVSEGETREETLANIREAIECYLDVPEELKRREDRWAVIAAAAAGVSLSLYGGKGACGARGFSEIPAGNRGRERFASWKAGPIEEVPGNCLQKGDA